MKKAILFILISTQYLLAVVTIAPVEIGEKAGFSGNAGASLETKRGTTEKDNYKAALRLTYDNNSSYVVWGELSGEYGESNKVEDTNQLYAHIRYIHALNDESVRGELLGQMQKDKFKLIDERTLGGAGLRFKAFEDYKGYLGLGGFYEHISYTSDDPKENNIRVNSYFMYSADFSNDSSLSYTFYYQPLAKDFTDYIQLHKVQLSVNILKRLYLNFQVAYDIDSKPPQGVSKYNFYQETAFLFKF